jgi:hypothetical protein
VRVSSNWPVQVADEHSVELGVRLSAAGLGKATVIRADPLQVEVMQSLAVAEIVGASSTAAPFRAFASLGGGAYRVEVEGIGAEQAVGRSEDHWSGMLTAGAGVSMHALAPWFVELEGQGLFATSPTTVRIDRTYPTGAATFGRPLLLLSLGIGVSL